ncbi:MAG: hypothetical protein C5B59_08950 [Bacteroidetes bacterium]|nr:MAG: hypothetical protein C5B59_08950 [Bacteroidota bacterium]
MLKTLSITVLIAILLLSSFSLAWNSPVKGTVYPTNAGLKAWLFSLADTFNAPVEAGIFQINDVKPGSYTLMIEGKPPFRNSVKTTVVVVDGQMTDVGVIQMEP